MGDFSDFQRGQIVGAHLSGSSVIKMVMTTYTNHGRASSSKRNGG
jgi:hypothetical protein